MKRLFYSLPGPMPVKVVLTVVIAIVLLVILLAVYDWMGRNLVDTGGGIG